MNSRFEPELVDPSDPNTEFFRFYRENLIGGWQYDVSMVRPWFPLDYYLSIPDQQISFGKPIFRSDLTDYHGNDKGYCWYIPNSYYIFQANTEYKIALTREKPEFDTTFKEYDYAFYFTQDETSNSFTHTVYFTKANDVFLTCEYKSINTDTVDVITTATFSCTPEKYKPLPTDRNFEYSLRNSIGGLIFGNIYPGPQESILVPFEYLNDTIHNESGRDAVDDFVRNMFLTNDPLSLTLINDAGDQSFYYEVMQGLLRSLTHIYNIPANHSFSLDNFLAEDSIVLYG